MQNNLSLSIDIGGTAAKYAFITPDCQLVGKSEFPTGDLKTPEEFYGRLLSVAGQGIAAGAVNLGISCPGIFRADGQCIGGVENLAFLEGTNMLRFFHRHCPSLKVSVMNDGAAAALGEYWLGSGQKSRVLFCITLGTGIGSALVLDGRPYQGSHFLGGEIGYSDYRSPQDYLELNYSTLGILRRASALTGAPEMDGFTFIDRVRKEDPVCLSLLDDWTAKLGRTLANIILILDPDRVVIGGGISKEEDVLIPLLKQKINDQLPPIFQNRALIRAASLSNDAGLFGAVKPFFEAGEDK